MVPLLAIVKSGSIKGSPMMMGDYCSWGFRARRTESRKLSIILFPSLYSQVPLSDRVPPRQNRTWAAGMLPAQ